MIMGRRAGDRTRKVEYRIRFDSAGLVLGESLHSSLGEQLGITLGDAPEPLTIFDYLKRVGALDKGLPKRLARRVRVLLDSHEEFSLNGDFRRGAKNHHLHISGRAIRNLDGSMVFTLLFLDDTEHTQLRRLYEYMFRLANHELKGPLACIVGATEYAEEHVKAGSMEDVRTCLEMIDRNAHVVEEMIERYLNLSLIESGSFKIELSDVLISDDVLNPVVAELQPALRAKEMTVEFECLDMDLEPHVPADDDKTAIVLRNLLSNAVKYGAPNTPIRVTLRGTEEGFELAVENEGPNIPESQLNQLFRKFVRLDATQGTKGSGLGLYNARRIVELWEGAIRVESSSDRTRFTFTLPVV